MTGVYNQFFNLIVTTLYGDIDLNTLPKNILQWTYNFSWFVVVGILLLVILLVLFGVWLVSSALFSKKKKSKDIHYYYHKDR